MKIVELVILIPCHSLEDFPQDHDGDDADSLLAAWSALWHPSLLAAAESAPHWYRVDTPPADIAGRLIVLPTVGQDRLPVGFVARCKTDGAVLLRKFKSRAELVASALTALDSGQPPVPEELVADFLALGYCRLQVDLLARHMRYSSNLDEVYFNQQVVAAASAAVSGDEVGARERLTSCFACLYEARKYFYPVDVYLLDLTLVAGTTLGESLRRELARSQAANLLMSGAVVEQLAREQPQTRAALESALAEGTADLIGGEQNERELPRLPLEEVFGELAAGLASYDRHLKHRPTTFGRRRFGLTPSLPQILDKLEFRGAIHCTLDDGVFPLGQQAKTRWEGLDGTLIDAYAQVPRDAAQTATFLQLARKLGESMDNDHVAMLVFAHWPSMASYWYEDLRRIARYSPVLGKFARFSEFFSQTEVPPIYSRFTADEYRSPYLMQAVIRRQSDPISRVVREHRAAATRAAVASLRMLTRLIGEPITSTASTAAETSACGAVDPATDTFASLLNAPSAPDELTQALNDFAAAVPRRSGPALPGLLLVNPLSFGCRANLEWPATAGLPRTSATVRESAVASDTVQALVDVPAMGFTRIELEPAPGKAGKRLKPIAEDNVLRNEHFSVTISPNTGGIQSVHDYKQRGNRLSQRLALRMPGEAPMPGELWRDPDETAIYTAMVADTLTVTGSGSSMGEIVTSGGLVDAEGKRLATYRQRVQLWQGSRIAWLRMEIDPLETLRSDPWNSYIAARFAWSDPAAVMYRGVHLARQQTVARRIEAPEYLEIEGDSGTTTLLTGGHAYHRRVGDRTLDSLLVVRGETARQFDMGIGLDVAHPHVAALELLSPPLLLQEDGRPPTAAETGWLFHLDTRSVVATHWEALQEASVPSDAALPGSSSRGGAGRPSGFRVRLLDASGRGGRALLRTPWPVSLARRTNFLGETLAELSIEDDKIAIDFAPHEWVQVEAWWSG
jgi:alpha-mannosidase